MGRGIEKKAIFINNNDREDFISRLAALAESGSMEIYAWALLENHFHGRVLCWLAVRELGYSGAEVARYLGVTNACVIRSVPLGKPSKRTKYF